MNKHGLLEVAQVLTSILQSQRSTFLLMQGGSWMVYMTVFISSDYVIIINVLNLVSLLIYASHRNILGLAEGEWKILGFFF